MAGLDLAPPALAGLADSASCRLHTAGVSLYRPSAVWLVCTSPLGHLIMVLMR